MRQSTWCLLMGVPLLVVGVSAPAFAGKDATCDGVLSAEAGGNWTVRWGSATPDTLEPPLHVCPPDPAPHSVRLTTATADLNAVGLEWYKGSPSASLRTIDVSFMVPALDDTSVTPPKPQWSHIAAFAAYRPPITDPDPYAFGRIGADAFHELLPDGKSNDRLVLQFDNAGIPLCDGMNLHGWVPIPGNFKANHWYRLSAHIRQLPAADGLYGLQVIGVLQDLEEGNAVIATTSHEFPSTCTPPWYAQPETRWAVGVLDLDPASAVDTYVDDVSVRPEQTPPTGTITINSGASYTRFTSVSLTLSATDTWSKVTEMQFSNDGTTYSTPEPYQVTKPSWSLLLGDGLKSVYAKFKDELGNWMTTVAVDSISLDKTAPTVSFMNPTSGSTVKGTVTVQANATENAGGSGVASVRFYLDGALKSTDTTAPYEWNWDTLTASTGSHTLRAIAYDVVGNSRSASITVIVSR